jgi:hypothetical protein
MLTCRIGEQARSVRFVPSAGRGTGRASLQGRAIELGSKHAPCGLSLMLGAARGACLTPQGRTIELGSKHALDGY